MLRRSKRKVGSISEWKNFFPQIGLLVVTLSGTEIANPRHYYSRHRKVRKRRKRTGGEVGEVSTSIGDIFQQEQEKIRSG